MPVYAVIILGAVYLVVALAMLAINGRKEAVKRGNTRVTLIHIAEAEDAMFAWLWPVLLVMLAIVGLCMGVAWVVSQPYLWLINVKPLPGAIEQKIEEEKKTLAKTQRRLRDLELELQKPIEQVKAESWNAYVESER